MTHEEAVQAGWKPRSAETGFTELVGAFWSRRDGDGWRYAALPDERHVNNRGVVHGGLLLAFADHALGLTVWERIGRRHCATVQLNMQFVEAGQPGAMLELDAEIVRTARSLVFVRGIIRAGDRTVAMADGIWKILGPGPSTPGSDTGSREA